MNSKNNLSDVLSKLLLLNNNSIESFSRINEAITSDSESVTLNIENENGKVQTFTIPSFGYLKNSIERLNNNLNAITNINGGSSTVRLSDGTYRKVLTSKLPTEANAITKMNSVNTFKVKSNYFFENMMNPLLCVTIDLTNQVPLDTERVSVKRFLLDADTTAKKELFETAYNHNSNIDYNNFLYSLIQNGINYVLDEETVELPARMKRYDGRFSVLKITNDSVTELINGANVTRTRKLIKLDTLYYTDNEAGYANTMQLAVGDSLEVNSDPVDTRYKITHIDTSTNTVILELVEGYQTIKIGSDFFKVSAEKTKDITLDVTVGFNERCVVFVKPINADSNILASAWSPGTGFFSNDLTLKDTNGNTVTLQQFYQKSVVDFGAFLLSYANDWYPSSSEGVIPNAPVLDSNNFKVVQINNQVTKSKEIDTIKQLNAEKTNLATQIKSKSVAINELKSKINSTNYASTTLKNADILELQNKVKDYENTVSTYSSAVSTISSMSEASSVANVSPKYRIRGFWEMPQEKSTLATGSQAIIKFKIRYRYLSAEGSANSVEQIGDTTVGSFSNYAVEESVLRERVKDTNGIFYWKPIDINDSDEININQLDIPITKGEQVEIQVKSISEAGFPSNPLESEWSEPIVISFPEEYSANSIMDDILKENNADSSQMQIEKTLTTKGIMSHISDSFSANETNFSHSSLSIASGFVSDDQTPISLYTKLAEMQTTINQLLEIIGNSTGTLIVTLSDDNGSVYTLTQDSVTKINAGTYVNSINKNHKKGDIVTKNFHINIQNTANTGLRLLAHLSGSRSRMVQESKDYANGGGSNTHTYNNDAIYPNASTYDSQDNLYNTFYRYDLVPINVYSPDSTTIDGVVVCGSNYQSAQCNNQYINMRYYNVSGDVKLYMNEWGNEETPTNNMLEKEWHITDASSSTTPPTFVWNCNNGFDTNGEPIACDGTTAINIDSSFMLHINHPDISSRANWLDKLKQVLGLDSNVNANYSIQSNAAYNKDYNKYIFRLPMTESYAITNIKNSANIANTQMRKTEVATLKNKINVQLPYEYGICDIVQKDTNNNALNSAPITFSNFISGDLSSTTYKMGMTHKIGYEPNDKYLIGENTCTSYLFLNPSEHAYIQVEGDSRMSSKVVAGESMISIPITFQYRMTDYYGSGDTGTGRILGKAELSNVNKTNINNIYMSNRIGFDIWHDKNTPTSFDVEIYATYGESSTTIDPSSMVQYNAATMTQAVNGARNSVLGGSNETPTIDVLPTKSSRSKGNR